MPKQPVICRAKCIRLVGTSIPYRISFVYPSTTKNMILLRVSSFFPRKLIECSVIGQTIEQKKTTATLLM